MKYKPKPLYTLELYYEGQVSQSFATTDYDRARKVYWKFSIKYGYPPRVTVDHVRLFTHEADNIFKFNRYGNEHKQLFEKGGLENKRRTHTADAGRGVLSKADG